MNPTADSCDPIEAILADYLTRLDDGGQPNSEEFLARYPEHAEELSEFFGALDYLDSKLSEACKSHSGRATRESARPFTRPEIEGFEVLEELGSGSQGVVYKAVQHGTKRVVALKVIHDAVFASRKDRHRFGLEVELASRLQHPNIAAIYESGELAGRAYYAMQYVQGDPLDVYLGTRTLAIRETLALFLQMCDAVAYAHRRGVIHRDLKPSNMIVDVTGTIHIVDFGLAKAVAPTPEEEWTQVTQVGDFAGTWYYASPEQVKRDPALVDIRTDVYALGVILYELLTDCYPYELPGGSSSDIANQILAARPIRPSAIRRDIDSDLETITLRALEKERERRYQSVPAMSDDIRRYLRGDAIEAKRDSSLYVLRKTLRRHRLPVALGLGAIVALAVVAVTEFMLYAQARELLATLQQRTDSRHENEQYLMKKFDEFIWTTNRFAENPELVDQIFPRQPGEASIRKSKELMDRLDQPVALEAGDEAPSSPDDGTSSPSKSADDTLMEQIENMVLGEEFAIDLRTFTGSNFAMDDMPRSLGMLERVCIALCHRADRAAQSGDFVASAGSLSAVRTIGVKLGDGRLIHHKSMAVTVRTLAYETVLGIFQEFGANPDVRPIVDWALLDPPLVGYRLALIHERYKLSQIFEEATFAKKDGDGMYFDIETFNRRTGVLARKTEMEIQRIRAAADETSWTELLSLIDRFIVEEEQWDSLSYPELSSLNAQQMVEREANTAWQLLRTVFPGHYLGFRERARAKSIRAGMLVSSHLVRYRLEHGEWPEELNDEIIPVGVLDPYTNKPFGYLLLDDGPLLYSIGEDLEDNSIGEDLENNAGRQRDWSAAGTDVILLDMR